MKRLIGVLFIVLLLFFKVEDASADTCRAVLNEADYNITPLSLSFTATAGGSNPASQSFVIKNTPLIPASMRWWFITAPPSWLSFSPNPTSSNCSGDLLGPGVSQSITVLVDIAGLSAGNYNSSNIQIGAGNGACGDIGGIPNKSNLNFTQNVAISLTVNPAPSRVLPIPKAPEIGQGQALSPTVIRWNFTDQANNETGFRLWEKTDSRERIIVDTSPFVVENLSYLDEINLLPNTQYSNRYVQTFTGQWTSPLAGPYPPVYTFMPNPTDLKVLTTENTKEVKVQAPGELPNLTEARSGLFFSAAEQPSTQKGFLISLKKIFRSLKAMAHNMLALVSNDLLVQRTTASVEVLPILDSGWIKEKEYFFSNLKPSAPYVFSIKARNGDGLETETFMLKPFTLTLGGPVEQKLTQPVIETPPPAVIPVIPTPVQPVIETPPPAVIPVIPTPTPVQPVIETPPPAVIPVIPAPAPVLTLSLTETNQEKIKEFQRSKGLKPVGIIGPRTRALIQGQNSATHLKFITQEQAKEARAYQFQTELKRGQSSKEVLFLQRMLYLQSYYFGLFNRFFSPLTEKALKNFQRINNLPQTGILDKGTRRIMNTD